jgi:hypothetical protein
VRVGDKWTLIDYSKKPEEWMKPLQRGTETDLIEIAGSWYLDDLPPMMFIKKAPNSHGFVNPRHLEEMWRDQFDWVYREMDYAVLHVHDPSGCGGRPASAVDVGALVQPYHSASGCEVHHLRRDRERLRAAQSAARRSERERGSVAGGDVCLVRRKGVSKVVIGKCDGPRPTLALPLKGRECSL